MYSPGQSLELRDGGGLRDVELVEQVVRHSLPFCRCDLGGADVHPPIDLHGVGVDDLAAQLIA